MHCSGSIIAWGIIFSRLALSKSHPQPLEKDLNHRSSQANRARRSLVQPQYNSNSYVSSSGSATTSSSSEIVATVSNISYPQTIAPAAPTASAEIVATVSNISIPQTTAVATPNASAEVVAAVSNISIPQTTAAAVTAAPTVTQTIVVPVPTCDATQPKFSINSALVKHNGQLREISGAILDLSRQVDDDSIQQIAALIATELQKSITAFKFCLSSVQLCGIDPRPLTPNSGISLSDVSWSALQIVLTLKTIFESVSSLYKPYPIVEKLCSDILLKLSTSLASLTGACSEQLNLFDTRFFPLVTPQLKEFMEVDNNFSSFFGSFVPS